MASSDRLASQDVVAPGDRAPQDGRVGVPGAEELQDPAAAAAALIADQAMSIFLAVEATTSEIAARADEEAGEIRRAGHKAAAPALGRLEDMSRELEALATELGQHERERMGGMGMAGYEPDGPRPADGTTPSERIAAEAGSLVGEQVRRAIDAAERSAQELRRTALDEASADREQVDRAAALVLARIDEVEAGVGRLLQAARDDVARTAAERTAADRGVLPPAPEPEPAPVDAIPEAAAQEPEPDPPQAAVDEESPFPVAAPDAAPVGDWPPRRRLFAKRSRAPSVCDVCGRVGQAGDEAQRHWRHVGRVRLCAECQAQGWRLPDGSTVPYRTTDHGRMA